LAAHPKRDGKEGTMRVGARNRIVGKVSKIDKGKIMCFVALDIPAKSKMGSVMTLESLKELKLKKGDEVEVIVKAVNVLLIKP
jgi:molybdopterin-binding protein